MGNAPQWHAIGKSVRGATHVRAGLPNQDAIRWLPASGIGPPLILTLSDGHGSAKSFRSDIGSRLATDTAVWLLQDLLDGQPDPTNLSAIKRTAEERLPQEIVRQWQENVDAHLAQTPFSPEELENLEESRDAKARRTVESHPHLAYGATLLSILITDDFILYLQLGDGDILIVLDNGEVTRPLPEDARLFANQTTSLCMKDAWREVRFRFQALYGPLPALILAATDGYANSFVDDTAFRKVGTDILDILRTEGLETVENNLETWLREASEAGSGDDITLGLICRTDIIGSAQDQPLSSEAEKSSRTEEAMEKAGSSASERGRDTEEQPEPEEQTPTPPTTPDAETAPPPPSKRKQRGKEEGPQEPVKPWFELPADYSE